VVPEVKNELSVFFFKGQAALGYGLVTEEAGSMFLRKIKNHSQNNTMTHPRINPYISFYFKERVLLRLIFKVQGKDLQYPNFPFK
jgi:hypothetical protein